MHHAEMAYPLEEGETRKWYDFTGWTRSVEERMPSLDKSLDRYFEQYMESIVQEWDLLTEYDLAGLEGRLTRIAEELNQLEKGHSVLAERAHALDASVKGLEGRR